jgi:hypothetical protein
VGDRGLLAHRLNIIGFKVHQMSVAQRKNLRPVLAVLEDKLGASKGREAWEDIVEFMSGRRPSATSDDQRLAPGTEKCIAIVYQAQTRSANRDARADDQARRHQFNPEGIRPDNHDQRGPRFDSAKNAKREMQIVQVARTT